MNLKKFIVTKPSARRKEKNNGNSIKKNQHTSFYIRDIKKAINKKYAKLDRLASQAGINSPLFVTKSHEVILKIGGKPWILIKYLKKS